MVYKGMMLSDVPNLALCFGYTNASWTLKADLTAELRLPAAAPHGPARRAPSSCRAAIRRSASQPFLELHLGLRAARERRSLPKQGTRRPWQVHQNYFMDMLALRFGRVDDGVLRFGAAGAPP